MDQAVETVLRAYEKRSAEESEISDKMDNEEFAKNRDQFLLCVGPATGHLLNLLATQLKAKTILEIGTSYGYSTTWLAEAARTNGGKVITLDAKPDKQTYARTKIQKAGLESFVEFRVGDALESLAKIEGPVDFVLLDLWKQDLLSLDQLFKLIEDLSGSAE